jgi:hypothetical protein
MELGEDFSMSISVWRFEPAAGLTVDDSRRTDDPIYTNSCRQV